MPSVLIAYDFKQCMRAKFMVAQGSCNGPTCTLECKNALLAAEASQQCHIAMLTRIVPRMKQVVAEKCPSNFNFDFVANGLVDGKFANEQRMPSVELIADDFRQRSWLHKAGATGRLAPLSARLPCLPPSEPLMEVAATSWEREPTQLYYATLR